MGSAWLTRDGFARVCGDGLYVSDDPCAAVCGGEPISGACCIDAPGNGVYPNGTFGNLYQVIQFANLGPTLQCQNVPMRDEDSTEQCDGLVTGITSIPNSITPNLQYTDPQTVPCSFDRDANRTGINFPWSVQTAPGIPVNSGFQAKTNNRAIVAESFTQIKLWTSYLWPNGIVSPRVVYQMNVSASVGWPTDGGFQGFGGFVEAQTQQPNNISELLYPDGSSGSSGAYMGLQMVGSASASFSSACGSIQGFTNTSSVTGGLYARQATGRPDNQFVVEARVQFIGLIEATIQYPWYGPNPVVTFVRFARQGTIGDTIGIFPVSYCNAPGATSTRGTPPDLVIQRFGRSPLSPDPAVAAAAAAQIRAMGISCCGG